MQSLRDCKFGEHNQREMIKRLEKLELTDLLSTLQRNLSDRKEQGKEMPTLTLRTTTGKATTANDSRSGKGPNSKNRSDDKKQGSSKGNSSGGKTTNSGGSLSSYHKNKIEAMQDGDMELGDGCFNCGNPRPHQEGTYSTERIRAERQD